MGERTALVLGTGGVLAADAGPGVDATGPVGAWAGIAGAGRVIDGRRSGIAGPCDAHASLAVLNFDLGELRFVEHARELAHQLNVDRHARARLVGHRKPSVRSEKRAHLSDARRRVQREQVGKRPETRDRSACGLADEADVAKGFARVGVRQVNLDHRHGDRLDGIV